MPGTPRVPMTNPYRADYYRYIAAGYNHAQASWLADCDHCRAATQQAERAEGEGK